MTHFIKESAISLPSGVFSTCGSLWMGAGTYEVPLELFKLNRHRLCHRLKTMFKNRPVILLEGGKEVPFYNTDQLYSVFRQEPYFMWTFGVLEPGCSGAIDVATNTAYLFVPRPTPGQVVWKGETTLDTFSGRYNIRNVQYCDEMETTLFNMHPSLLLVLSGVNSDSGLPFPEAKFPGMENFDVNKDCLFKEMTELRVIKTELEIKVMEYVIDVASEGHRKVMRYVKGGNKFEYQCEAEFLHHCYSVGGCRHAPYPCICASDFNTAILHYGHAGAPNDRYQGSVCKHEPTTSNLYEPEYLKSDSSRVTYYALCSRCPKTEKKFINPGDLCTFSMGTSYFGYSCDITCSFPSSGKFSHNQRIIYEAVLAANQAVFSACKPGVSWADMHILSQKTLLKELVERNLLEGDPDAMVDVGLGAVFMPHGVGHLLGMDVHDVGGYIEGQPPRRGEPTGIDKLRTARILQPGMVMTVAPGCYFIDVLLNEALKNPVLSKFMVAEEIERFRGFGGIRIEDNVLITTSGAVNMTKVPRTVKEIEKYMAGKDDKKYRRMSR